MTYLKTYEDVQLNIHAAGVKMNDYLDRKIQNMIKTLKKMLPETNGIDIYLKSNDAETAPRTVLVQFGISGTDIVASDSGNRWKILLKNVEKKIVRQLEKRKSLLNRTNGLSAAI